MRAPARFRVAQPADPVIRVAIRSPEQMFSSIDPSPFYERDLDDAAERFILDWAREVPSGAALSLEVTVTEPGAPTDGGRHIAEAVHLHFRRRADRVTRELRELMRRGRISAVIGLSCLAGGMTLGDLLAGWLGQTATANVVREGLHLLGWVSTWKPIELFLYGWWPLVGDRRLYERLSQMPVDVRTVAS